MARLGPGEGEAALEPLPALWPMLAISAVGAAWIDFSSFHRDQTADSLLLVLISLYRWTPFYWEQDRFGMLIPLIASPLRNPLWNLFLQTFLTVFLGLASFFVIARYAFRHPSWPLVGIAGLALYLTLVPAGFRFVYLTEQGYGTSLFLGVGALLLVEQRPVTSRIVAALLLLVVAHWVNVALVILLVPLVASRALLAPAASTPLAERFRDENGIALALVTASGFAGWCFTRLARWHTSVLNPGSPSDWANGWAGFAVAIWNEVAPSGWLPAIGVLLICGVFLSPRSAIRGRSASVVSSFSLVVTAVAYFLVVGTLRWVSLNHFNPRYAYPALIALQAGAIGLFLASLDSRAENGLRHASRLARWLALPVLLACIAFAYGKPSWQRANGDIRALGHQSADLIRARCTHIAGNYWEVWPSVFRANLALYERGVDRIIWGLSLRSRPTLDRAREVPASALRVGVPRDDPEAASWLEAYGFPPLVVIERRGTIDVLGPG